MVRVFATYRCLFKFRLPEPNRIYWCPSLLQVVSRLGSPVTPHLKKLTFELVPLKFSRPFFDQLEVKPKQIVARAFTFSCALCRVLIGLLDYFLPF